jgi:hypothetical protein
MSTYINFEEDALGDGEILGEQDNDYFTDNYDASPTERTDRTVESERSNNDMATYTVQKPQQQLRTIVNEETTLQRRGDASSSLLEDKGGTSSSILIEKGGTSSNLVRQRDIKSTLESTQDRPSLLHDQNGVVSVLHNSNNTETCYIPPDIRGTQYQMADGRTLQDHLIQVCVEVQRVFNTKVRATPAKVTPTKLEVDHSIWEDPANALGPRQHTPAKQAEVRKQVDKMRPLGVISDSQAPY